MDYKQLNANLGNLQNLRSSKRPVHIKVVNEIDDDGYGSQGDSNEIYEVYDVGLPGGMFVKLQIGSDSYGYNEFVVGIEFVQAVEKTVKVYEYQEN